MLSRRQQLDTVLLIPYGDDMRSVAILRRHKATAEPFVSTSALEIAQLDDDVLRAMFYLDSRPRVISTSLVCNSIVHATALVHKWYTVTRKRP
jgi:hypothetical protein